MGFDKMIGKGRKEGGEVGFYLRGVVIMCICWKWLIKEKLEKWWLSLLGDVFSEILNSWIKRVC